MEDLSKNKYGRLRPIEVIDKTKQGSAIWKCQCECGKFKNIRAYHLKGKKIRSCGCLKRETVNLKWNNCGEIGGWLWNNYRISAKIRKIKFNVTIEDLWEQALKQNKKCAVSGDDLIFNLKQTSRKNGNVSLDRIDSSKGYEKGNIQWVTKEVNFAKHSLSLLDFVNLCHKVSKNFIK